MVYQKRKKIMTTKIKIELDSMELNDIYYALRKVAKEDTFRKKEMDSLADSLADKICNPPISSVAPSDEEKDSWYWDWPTA